MHTDDDYPTLSSGVVEVADSLDVAFTTPDEQVRTWADPSGLISYDEAQPVKDACRALVDEG